MSDYSVIYRLSVRDVRLVIERSLFITRLDAPRLRMNEDRETLAVPVW